MVGLLSLTYSCLGGSTEMDDWNLSNAQIATFSLECDSIDGLSDVVFTIDQINGKIYNKDSMKFGTRDDFKVLATVGYDSPYGVRGLYFIEQATGDTVKSTTDSINFSEPVMITVYAYDGVATKTYEAQLNIHQVDPDIMVWEKYGDILPGRSFKDMKAIKYHDSCYVYVNENSVYQLYKSDLEDLYTWERVTLSGFPDHALLMQMLVFQGELYVVTEEGGLYVSSNGLEWRQVAMDNPVKALLGYLPESTITGRDDVLCFAATVDGELRFVTMDNQLVCTQGQVVPEAFPLSGFGNFSYLSMYYPRLVIASGRDANNRTSNMVWATMDGLSWSALSKEAFTFSNREGAAVFYYDYSFFLIGGIADDAGPSKDILFSIDQGVTWLEKVYVYNKETASYDEESYYKMPGEFVSRGYISVILDKDNYMLLFGGKATNDTNVMNEIWRGRINRLGFGMSR